MSFAYFTVRWMLWSNPGCSLGSPKFVEGSLCPLFHLFQPIAPTNVQQLIKSHFAICSLTAGETTRERSQFFGHRNYAHALFSCKMATAKITVFINFSLIISGFAWRTLTVPPETIRELSLANFVANTIGSNDSLHVDSLRKFHSLCVSSSFLLEAIFSSYLRDMCKVCANDLSAKHRLT